MFALARGYQTRRFYYRHAYGATVCGRLPIMGAFRILIRR